MKYLVTLMLFICISAPLIAQESFTTITKAELHDLGNGKATVKLWIKSNEIEKLTSLKIQVSGNRIPRGTMVTTIKGGSVVNGDQTQNFELEGSLFLYDIDEEKENATMYEVKDESLNKFRKLEPGTLIYFPPIDKTTR